MVIPVYRALKRTKLIDPIIVGLTTARKNLIEESIPFISYSNFATGNQAALDMGSSLISHTSQHPDIPKDESIAYMGLNYLELVKREGAEVAKERFESEGRKAFEPVDVFTKYFRDEQPDLVVATNSPRSERAALLAAQGLGIKTVCMVDLFTKSELEGFLSNPGYGTKICVLNEKAKEILVSAGRPEIEIEVTGNPAFDYLRNTVPETETHSYKLKNNLKGKRIILWARSTLPEDKNVADEVEQKLISLIEKNSNYNLIIRPHPNETPPIYKNHPTLHISGGGEKLIDVLAASDVVITLYSTVAVEAHLMNKSVIQITNTSLFDSFNCVEAGIALGLDSSENFEIFLEKVKMQSKHISANETQAADTIAEIIHKLLNLKK